MNREPGPTPVGNKILGSAGPLPDPYLQVVGLVEVGWAAATTYSSCSALSKSLFCIPVDESGKRPTTGGESGHKPGADQIVTGVSRRESAHRRVEFAERVVRDGRVWH